MDKLFVDEKKGDKFIRTISLELEEEKSSFKKMDD
jgi:hypothetical protein